MNEDFILGSFLSGFGGMAYESEEQANQRKVKNTEIKDCVVDTCYANDTEMFETGISYKKINDGNWVVVEEYSTKEEAKKGHEKWVKKMKKNPKSLYDVHREMRLR